MKWCISTTLHKPLNRGGLPWKNNTNLFLLLLFGRSSSGDKNKAEALLQGFSLFCHLANCKKTLVTWARQLYFKHGSILIKKSSKLSEIPKRQSISPLFTRKSYTLKMRTIWSSKKRQVVLPKTTACFAQNDGSFLFHRRVVFFSTISSSLASLGKDTNKGRNRTRKHRSFLPLLQNAPFKVRA